MKIQKSKTFYINDRIENLGAQYSILLYCYSKYVSCELLSYLEQLNLPYEKMGIGDVQ